MLESANHVRHINMIRSYLTWNSWLVVEPALGASILAWTHWFPWSPLTDQTLLDPAPSIVVKTVSVPMLKIKKWLITLHSAFDTAYQSSHVKSWLDPMKTHQSCFLLLIAGRIGSQTKGSFSLNRSNMWKRVKVFCIYKLQINNFLSCSYWITMLQIAHINTEVWYYFMMRGNEFECWSITKLTLHQTCDTRTQYICLAQQRQHLSSS